jgi:hypothetical protein
MRSVIVLLAILATTILHQTAAAKHSRWHSRSWPRNGTYAEGHTSPKGYVWRDNLWWKNGKPYSRFITWRYIDGKRKGRYEYKPYRQLQLPKQYQQQQHASRPAVAPKYAPPRKYKKQVRPKIEHHYTDKGTVINNVLPQQTDWRKKLLEVLEARENASLNYRSQVQEQADFAAALEALGLTAPYGGYGVDPHVVNPYATTYVPNAQQGATVYGRQFGQSYELKQVLDFYGLDPNLVIAQQSRAQERAAQLASQYHDGIMKFSNTIVSAQENTRLQVALTLAEASLIRAAKQKSGVATLPSQIPVARPPPKSDDDLFSVLELAPQLERLFEKKCFKCHSNSSRRSPESDLFPARMSLEKFITFKKSQRNHVLSRVAAGEMPPDGNDPLTSEELALVLSWAKAVGGGELGNKVNENNNPVLEPATSEDF